MALGDDLRNIAQAEAKKKPTERFKESLDFVVAKYDLVSAVKNDIVTKSQTEAKKGLRCTSGRVCLTHQPSEMECGARFERSYPAVSVLNPKKRRIFDETFGNEILSFCKENKIILCRLSIGQFDLEYHNRTLYCDWLISW